MVETTATAAAATATKNVPLSFTTFVCPSVHVKQLQKCQTHFMKFYIASLIKNFQKVSLLDKNLCISVHISSTTH
jgi:hypothetical protein